MIDIVVPELGVPTDEQITVSCWLVGIGDEVIEGDRLVELLINEITFDVSSPCSGRLASVAVEVEDAVCPGTVLGTIEPEEDSE